MRIHMAPSEYRYLVALLGYKTHREAADALGLSSHATSLNYARGRTRIPGPVANLLRERAEHRSTVA